MIFNQLNLKDVIFVGIVEDVNDEKRIGRIKVRVQNVFNEIPLEDIPWAEPQRSLNGKSFCVPAIGKLVNVIFVHGNVYEPQYIYSEKYNTNLQQKLNDLDDKEYANFTALLMDHRTQMYADDTNLRLDYKFNQLSIKDDGIDIHLKDNNQELHLGHNYSNQSAMLGDHFLDWFDGFMNTLLKPISLIGNTGVPIVKPLVDIEIQKYQVLKKTFLSQHVKIVDNGSCKNVGENRKDSPAQDDVIDINDDKILNSPQIKPEIKKKITEKREEDNTEVQTSKPNPADKLVDDGKIVGGGEDQTGDAPEIKYIEPEILNNSEWLNKNLSGDEKYNFETTENVEERKIFIPEIETESTPSDPYDNFWVGRKGRSADSFEAPPVENETYGSYTTTSDSPVGYTSSGKKGPTKTLKSGKILENGKINASDLTEVEGFTVKGKEMIILLEKNASKEFIKLNNAWKAASENKSGKPLDISGEDSAYRTVAQQIALQISQGKDVAASAGSSPHGWGIAIDINGTRRIDSQHKGGTGLYKWLKKKSQEKEWKIQRIKWGGPSSERYAKRNNVVSENWERWHWMYTGPTVYNEESPVKKKQLSYTLVSYKSFAQKLYDAMNKSNDDEDAIYVVIKKMKTDDDVHELNTAFGIKILKKKKRNLTQWFKKELKTSELEFLNQILRDKNIKTLFI